MIYVLLLLLLPELIFIIIVENYKKLIIIKQKKEYKKNVFHSNVPPSAMNMMASCGKYIKSTVQCDFSIHCEKIV